MYGFELLDKFDTIEFADAKNVKLLDRIETKYVASLNNLSYIIGQLLNEGWKLQVYNGNIGRNYHNIYYDTYNLDIYNAHANKEEFRQKVRVRIYKDATYLEIKEKMRGGKSVKIRKRLKGDIHTRDKWLSKHFKYDYKTLWPVIENEYRRFTFINSDCTERVTIDTDIRFHNMVNDNVYLFDEPVIEYKHGEKPSTHLFDNMEYFTDTGFSKYWDGLKFTK